MESSLEMESEDDSEDGPSAISGHALVSSMVSSVPVEAAPALPMGSAVLSQTAMAALGVAASVGMAAVVGGPLGLLASLAGALSLTSALMALQGEIKRLRDENHRLREQATHDALTGLTNRLGLQEQLEQDRRQSRRRRMAMGIILADLDHFKSINDTYGHPVGDEVLRETGRRLAEHVRLGDTVGRYGGEEFLIVLPSCQARDVADAAERLRIAIASTPIETECGLIPVTLSLGAAVTDPDLFEPLDAIIHAADEALYRAKRGGRNRVDLAFTL
ncbi:MAG: GGDEF domain-containing protein [Candidatus Xenobia bacterium]